jgi:hypothetical protein
MTLAIGLFLKAVLIAYKIQTNIMTNSINYRCLKGFIMTFNEIAAKLQEELIAIIKSQNVNEYELIVFKYLFISELKIPVHEELGVRITEDSFIIHVIPDNLELALLKDLDDAFDKFRVTFLPNSYNILKLNFKLSD